MVIESEGHLAAKGIIVVLKPFDIEDLLDAVATQIGKAWESDEVGLANKVASTNDSSNDL
jgi:hypothetical protein